MNVALIPTNRGNFIPPSRNRTHILGQLAWPLPQDVSSVRPTHVFAFLSHFQTTKIYIFLFVQLVKISIFLISKMSSCSKKKIEAKTGHNPATRKLQFLTHLFCRFCLNMCRIQNILPIQELFSHENKLKNGNNICLESKSWHILKLEELVTR